MSTESIVVKKRTQINSRACRKLRSTGLVPAILYGHGEENVCLSLRSDVLGNVLKRGAKVLSLTGDVTDTALLRSVQWDTWGIEVLHVDLTRVSSTESVEVTLPIVLHGEAPGLNEGGQLNFVLHELTIECPASEIPEHLQVSVANLHLGQAIHASDIQLPSGATLVTQESEVIVQVVRPVEREEEDELPASLAEPELIRKEQEKEKED